MKAPAGVSSQGQVSSVDFFLYNFFKVSAQEISEGKKIPDVINVSLALGDFVVENIAGGGERTVKTAFDENHYAKFVEDARQVLDKTILVKSAGNNFPQPVDDMIRDLGDKIIVVGSADPGGFPSKFSQTSKEVVVLAPSDHYLQSININRQLTKYSGTSGAAPMVSAVLADVKSILPDLSRDEAAYMLRKTATPTSINMVSDVNGAGVLNHYKMLRFAKRLHEAGFADNRALLYNDALCNFTIEATNLRRDAQQLLKTSKDVDSYEKAFRKMRQAFFLDSSDMETRKALAKFYHRAGHLAVAEFYDEPVKLSKGLTHLLGRKYTSNVHKKLTQRMQMNTQFFVYKELENFTKWAERHEITVNPKEIKKMRISFAAIKSSLASMPDDIVQPEMLNNNSALKVIIMHTQKLVHAGKVDDHMLKLVLTYTDATMPNLLHDAEIIKYFEVWENKSVLQRIARQLKAHSELLPKIIHLI